MLLGTCCVTGLQSESRELRPEAHAWALRSLSTEPPSAEAPAPALARALVAFGGRPYGPAHHHPVRAVALRTACRPLLRHRVGGGGGHRWCPWGRCPHSPGGGGLQRGAATWGVVGLCS